MNKLTSERLAEIRESEHGLSWFPLASQEKRELLEHIDALQDQLDKEQEMRRQENRTLYDVMKAEEAKKKAAQAQVAMLRKALADAATRLETIPDYVQEVLAATEHRSDD